MINDFESNLPIPSSERNHGSSLEVCECQHHMHGQHPWRKAHQESEYDGADQATYLPEVVPHPRRKVMGLELPIAILTFFLALSLASVVLVGGLLGHKISRLEKQVPSLLQPQSQTNGSSSSPVPATIQSGSGSSSQLGLVPPPASDILQISIKGWTYYGCFYDQEARSLQPGYVYDKENMTNTLCADRCEADASYRFFGTEWRRCFCGETDALLKRAPDWACQTQCPGQQKTWEACGGDKYRISVWKRDK
ncbi:xylosyltransferase oxt [Cladorrhinum sp. PSN259]|nr:xylosyltransferase oxt [Cladorrhinum sp. PSN259]